MFHVVYVVLCVFFNVVVVVVVVLVGGDVVVFVGFVGASFLHPPPLWTGPWRVDNLHPCCSAILSLRADALGPSSIDQAILCVFAPGRLFILGSTGCLLESQLSISPLHNILECLSLPTLGANACQSILLCDGR